MSVLRCAANFTRFLRGNDVPANNRMHLTRSALAMEGAALAGDPECSTDLEAAL